MEQIEVEAYNCQIKKQNSKTRFTTSIDQLNSMKIRISRNKNS